MEITGGLSFQRIMIAFRRKYVTQFLTPVFTRSQHVVTAVAAATVAMTLGATPVEGSLMVATVSLSATRTVSMSGWTSALASPSDNLFVFYKIAGASESTSIAATWSTNADAGFSYMEFTNALAVPIPFSAQASSASTVLSLSLTGLSVDRPAISVGTYSNGSNQSWFMDNGFTNAGGVLAYGRAGWKIHSAPGNIGTTTWTRTPAGNVWIAMVKFYGKQI